MGCFSSATERVKLEVSGFSVDGLKWHAVCVTAYGVENLL